MSHAEPQPYYTEDRANLILHIVFLSMAVVIIGLSFLLNTENERQVFFPGMHRPIPSMCGSKVVLGINCPGCGLTRSFIAISEGRFGDAWRLNRASFVVYLFVLAQIPWHSMQLFRRWKGWPAIDIQIIYFVPVMLAFVLAFNWVLYMLGI